MLSDLKRELVFIKKKQEETPRFIAYFEKEILVSQEKIVKAKKELPLLADRVVELNSKIESLEIKAIKDQKRMELVERTNAKQEADRRRDEQDKLRIVHEEETERIRLKKEEEIAQRAAVEQAAIAKAEAEKVAELKRIADEKAAIAAQITDVIVMPENSKGERNKKIIALKDLYALKLITSKEFSTKKEELIKVA